MTDSIVNLIPLTKGDKNKVNKTLTEAIDMGFDMVLIVGLKESKYFLKTSGINETATTIGLLELLKQEVMK